MYPVCTLDIHPFMLSRWRKEVRDGGLRGRARRVDVPSRPAREIKQLIGSSAEEIRTGSALADAANDRMHEIVASVRRVNETLVTITASTKEQSESLGEVNGSVTTLDHMTQQNAALVEQSAAAATSLQSQAERLVEAMGRFRLTSAAMA